MLDIVITSDNHTPLFLQSVHSILDRPPDRDYADTNLVVIVSDSSVSQRLNRGLKRTYRAFVTVCDSQIYLDHLTVDRMTSALLSYPVVTMGDEEAPAVLGFNRLLFDCCFDESYLTFDYAIKDLLQQFKWRKAEIQHLEDNISHKPLGSKADLKTDALYFEDKWREVRLGQTLLINATQGY